MKKYKKSKDKQKENLNLWINFLFKCETKDKKSKEINEGEK